MTEIQGRNELGTAAFVTAIVGLVALTLFWPLGCVLSTAGFAFSIISIGRSPRGMAAAGLVLSAIGCSVFGLPILLVLYTTAFPIKFQTETAITAPAPPVSTSPSPVSTSPKAEIRKIKPVEKQKNGKNLISFELKNTSGMVINRIEAQITLRDDSGKVLADETIKAPIPDAIKPYELRNIQVPIRSAVASPCKAEVVILSVR